MDALAARSMRFNRHYIASFPTMPARVDYLTGRFTMSCVQWQPLAKTDVTVSDLLSNKGIHTAAVVDTPFYTRNGMNYDRIALWATGHLRLKLLW
jgi:arylsulfatase A-like enzyme